MNLRIAFFLSIIVLQILAIRGSPLQMAGLSKEYDNENRIPSDEQQDLTNDMLKRQTDLLDESCNRKTDCTCQLGNETLGCLARDDIVCPEIDSFDVGIECGLLFCTCFDREPETFHCLDTDDCPGFTNAPPEDDLLDESCNRKTDCTCQLGNETLGCLARDDIVCPEIDSFDVGIECGLLFCTCFDREPETFHCFDTNDCPMTSSTTRTPTRISATTAPMTTSNTVTNTTTPEDDCPNENE